MTVFFILLLLLLLLLLLVVHSHIECGEKEIDWFCTPPYFVHRVLKTMCAGNSARNVPSKMREDYPESRASETRQQIG